MGREEERDGCVYRGWVLWVCREGKGYRCVVGYGKEWMFVRGKCAYREVCVRVRVEWRTCVCGVCVAMEGNVGELEEGRKGKMCVREK